MKWRRISQLLGAHLAAACVTAFGGCAACLNVPAAAKILASETPPAQELPAPGPRGAEALEKAELRRNQAQYEAALTRATEGNLDDCETLLRTLLVRDPTHREGRLLLSEALLARHRTNEAEEQLRLCLMQHPDDAQAHFQLAALLETTGREALARQHFQKAAAASPALAPLVGQALPEA